MIGLDLKPEQQHFPVPCAAHEFNASRVQECSIRCRTR